MLDAESGVFSGRRPLKDVGVSGVVEVESLRWAEFTLMGKAEEHEDRCIKEKVVSFWQMRSPRLRREGVKVVTIASRNIYNQSTLLSIFLLSLSPFYEPYSSSPLSDHAILTAYQQMMVFCVR